MSVTPLAPRAVRAAPPMTSRLVAAGSQASRGAQGSARGTLTAPLPMASSASRAQVYARGREVAALLLFTSAVFLTLSLASFQASPSDPSVRGADWIGPVGASLARSLVNAIGVAAWTVPLECVVLVWPLLKNRASIATVARLAGDFLVVLIVASLLHVATPERTAFGAMPVCGSLGELFGEVLHSLFSSVGSFLVGLTAIALILIQRASFSFITTAQRATRGTEQAAGKLKGGLRFLAAAWERASALRPSAQEAAPREAGTTVSLERKPPVVVSMRREELKEPRERRSCRPHPLLWGTRRSWSLQEKALLCRRPWSQPGVPLVPVDARKSRWASLSWRRFPR